MLCSSRSRSTKASEPSTLATASVGIRVVVDVAGTPLGKDDGVCAWPVYTRPLARAGGYDDPCG